MNPVLILNLLCDLYQRTTELQQECDALKAQLAEREPDDG
jgi:AmiR/NasT family two-component response regulator